MSKKQMRIAVAKDVLKQVRARRIRATKGTYADFTKHDAAKLAKLDRDTELQELLPELKPCKACALGSMMLSHVRLYDDFKLSGLHFQRWWDTNDVYDVSMTGHDIKDRLAQVFAETQLVLIESAFERSDMSSLQFTRAAYVSGKKLEAAIDFGRKYRAAEARLVAIMKNIVKNEGTFKP